MTDDDRLREEIRALADRFEAGAEPEERVAARLSTRTQASRLPSAGLLAAVGVVIILATVGLPALLPDNFGREEPILPVGVFRSADPDTDGECVAIRVYDTTRDDGRLAFWRWAGIDRDGCAARTSNLFMGEVRIAVVTLPARTGVAERSGFRVDAVDPSLPPSRTLVMVLDPLASDPAGNSIAGWWDLPATAGAPAFSLERVEELVVPYRPE
jgi:hypothetical protein